MLSECQVSMWWWWERWEAASNCDNGVVMRTGEPRDAINLSRPDSIRQCCALHCFLALQWRSVPGFHPPVCQLLLQNQSIIPPSQNPVIASAHVQQNPFYAAENTQISVQFCSMINPVQNGQFCFQIQAAEGAQISVQSWAIMCKMCNDQSKICQVQRRVKQKKLVCKPQLLGWHWFGVDYKGGGLKPLLLRSLPHCQTLQGTGAVTSSLSCDRRTPVNLHSEINQMLASCKCSNNFDWVSLRRLSFWCWHVNIKLAKQQWSYILHSQE